MKVQGRNHFVVGSDYTEIVSYGTGVCWGHGRIKLQQLVQGRNCFCFVIEPDDDASPILSRSLRVSATQDTDKPEI